MSSEAERRPSPEPGSAPGPSTAPAPDTAAARAQGGEPVTLTDAKAMRAVAHPVRMALIELFGYHETLTATQASELLGESPANCAFHLRTLAKYGFVREAGGGKGRERPWTLVNRTVRITADQPDPQAALAADELSRLFLERWIDRARRVLRLEQRDTRLGEGIGLDKCATYSLLPTRPPGSGTRCARSWTATKAAWPIRRCGRTARLRWSGRSSRRPSPSWLSRLSRAPSLTIRVPAAQLARKTRPTDSAGRPRATAIDEIYLENLEETRYILKACGRRFAGRARSQKEPVMHPELLSALAAEHRRDLAAPP